jgi:hypothetical protein
LPRSCSHNEPTNPRNKPQTISKRKRNSRTRQNVRKHRADCLRNLDGLSASCGRPSENNSRTTSTAPSITDRPPNLVQPKAHGQTDRNESTQEHATNTKNNLPNRTSRIVRTVAADGPPTTHTENRARPLEGQTFLPFARSPKSTKESYQITGEG